MWMIWWPAFILPVLMVLLGLLGRGIPGFRYHSFSGPMDEERQQFADRQLRQLLWQVGLAFAALAFMVMSSVRLLPANVQQWLLYGAVALELLGAVLLMLPIERALKEYFDDEETEDKGDRA